MTILYILAMVVGITASTLGLGWLLAKLMLVLGARPLSATPRKRPEKDSSSGSEAKPSIILAKMIALDILKLPKMDWQITQEEVCPLSYGTAQKRKIRSELKVGKVTLARVSYRGMHDYAPTFFEWHNCKPPLPFGASEEVILRDAVATRTEQLLRHNRGVNGYRR